MHVINVEHKSTLICFWLINAGSSSSVIPVVLQRSDVLIHLRYCYPGSQSPPPPPVGAAEGGAVWFLDLRETDGGITV